MAKKSEQIRASETNGRPEKQVAFGDVSSPPPSPMKGADILVEALVREGVDVIFGYPGGASMEIHQALTRSRIRNVLCRHEQGEIFAAEGFAKASGRVRRVSGHIRSRSHQPGHRIG